MSRLLLNEGAAPSAPASGKQALYVEASTRKVRCVDSKGVDKALGDNDLINWLANSGFWFAQRQVPGTLTTYSNTTGRTYGADRWGMTNENASLQFQRIDTSGAPETNLQSRFYGRYKKITSAGKMVVTQVLEGSDATQLRGRTVRLQAKMRCSVASSMNVRLGLIQLTSAGTIDALPATYISAFGATGTDPTLGTNLAYIAPKSTVTPEGGTIDGNAIDCALTTSWVSFGACFDVPTNCKNLVASIWTDGQPAANDELNITEVSLTDGFEIQDWTPYQLQAELDRCQRFWIKTFSLETAPAQNAGLNTGEVKSIAGKAGAVGNSGIIAWRFPVRMRVQPTASTLFNPAAANALMRDITGAVDMGATASTLGGDSGMVVIATGNAATAVGNQVGIHITAEAEL